MVFVNNFIGMPSFQNILAEGHEVCTDNSVSTSRSFLFQEHVKYCGDVTFSFLSRSERVVAPVVRLTCTACS